MVWWLKSASTSISGRIRVSGCVKWAKGLQAVCTPEDITMGIAHVCGYPRGTAHLEWQAAQGLCDVTQQPMPVLAVDFDQE
jgi:hypothetical protein